MALFDQALISGANFVSTVVLARTLKVEEFGNFTVALIVIFMLNVVQSSVITQPHNSLGVGKANSEIHRYTSATALSQIVFALLIMGLTSLMAVCAVIADIEGAWSLIILAVAGVSWQGQEFCRRVLYTAGEIGNATANDSLRYSAQLAGFGYLWSSESLSANSALIAIAISSAIGIAFGCWQLKEAWYGLPSRRELQKTWSQNWNYGKWLLVGGFLGWFTTFIYPLIGAVFVTSALTGSIRAMDTILSPVLILITTLYTAATPKVAGAFAERGVEGVTDLIRTVSLLAGIPALMYCTAVGLMADSIVTAAYGVEFAQYSWLLPFMAVSTGLTILATPMSIGLLAMRRTMVLFRIQILSLCILVLGGILMSEFGAKGMAVGVVLNAAVAFAALWKAYARTMEGHPTSASTHCWKS